MTTRIWPRGLAALAIVITAGSLTACGPGPGGGAPIRPNVAWTEWNSAESVWEIKTGLFWQSDVVGVRTIHTEAPPSLLATVSTGVVSPDRKLVAFATSDPATNQNRIAVIDSRGAGSARTVVADAVILRDLVWSPDSHAIAFTRRASASLDQMLTVAVPNEGGTTASPILLTPAPVGCAPRLGTSDWRPSATSPMGEILFNEGGCEMMSSGNSYRVNAESGATPILVAASLGCVAWIDGTDEALCSEYPSFDILTVNATTGARSVVLRKRSTETGISPVGVVQRGGELMWHATSMTTTFPPTDINGLWVAPFDGSEIDPDTATPVSGAPAGELSPPLTIRDF